MTHARGLTAESARCNRVPYVAGSEVGDCLSGFLLTAVMAVEACDLSRNRHSALDPAMMELHRRLDSFCAAHLKNWLRPMERPRKAWGGAPESEPQTVAAACMDI